MPILPRMPDQEAIEAEVKSLAQEARANGQPAGAGAPGGAQVSGSVAAPIYLGKDTEFIPAKYVLHYSTVQCLNCGCVTHESKFYALNYIRSRVTGQPTKHMVPVDRALYNVPVERQPLRAHTTPFCAECESIDLSHLPEPPKADLLFDLEEPRLKGQKPKEAKEPKKPVTTKATLDDLA